MTELRDDVMFRMGAAFGDEIVKLVRTVRAYVVTIDEIDDAKGVAVVSLFEGQPIVVPLSTIGLTSGMFRMTPNVGSLAVIHYPNGNESEPVFIAFEVVDKIEIKRGETSLTWEITPPGRDSDGNELEGTDTEDVLSLTLGDSSVRITSELIEINGGALGDLIIIGKLTDRLNKLQSEINEIQANITSHTHTYVDSKGSAATPTPSVTAPATYTTKVLTSVSNSDYNNDKITQ